MGSGKYTIINTAFVLLGRGKFVVGDGSVASANAEVLYPNALDRALTKGFWRSAYKTLQLNGVFVEKRNQYVASLPVRYLVMVSVNETNWSVESRNKLYFSTPTIVIEYIESQREPFDATLIHYVALELAALLASSFTGTLALRTAFREEQEKHELCLIRTKTNEVSSPPRTSSLLLSK